MMSRRGGKRKPVLQLGNSSSKLHRYGYSKEFHSRDKKGQGAVPMLVGDYSDSESEDGSETEEQMGKEALPQDDDTAVDPSSVATPVESSDSGVVEEKGADMDDELKNFLSEIEAIPLPAEIAGGTEETKPLQAESNTDHPDGENAEQSVDTNISNKKSNSRHYSMFVKGEPEFVHSPSQDAKENIGQEKKSGRAEEQEEILPEEPTTKWQMVQDETTHFYYYWNVVTNEVTWEIPTEYTQYLLLHKEYEEKMAKYTPEQIQALRGRSAKHSKQESDISHSSSRLMGSGTSQQSNNSDNKSSLLSTENISNHTEVPRGLSPAKSLSPHPETNNDSLHRRHKKEKRHKKKHKHRHSDSDSGDDKRSPRMPDIGPPMLSEAGDKKSKDQKLLSIVPYLSDQDDEEEEEEGNSNIMPELGPPTITAVDSKVTQLMDDGNADSEPSMPELGPAVSVSASSVDSAATDEVVKSSSEKSMPDVDAGVLLLPPPPPPPEEKEDNVDKENVDGEEMVNDEKAVTNKTSDGVSPLIQENSISEHSDIHKEQNSVESESGGKEVVTNSTSNVDIVSEGIQSMKGDEKESGSKKSQKAIKEKKEVIDMFANDFPVSKLQTESTQNLTKHSPSNENTDGPSVKPKVEEEQMEEGEISESSDKDTALAKSKTDSSKITVKSKVKNSEDKEQKKSMNIVAYGSEEDEEEEGEVKEKYDKEEEKVSSKKKKKDKKKDSRKHKKDSKDEPPSILENTADKEIMSKMSATLDETISKIVNQTVSQAVAGMESEMTKKGGPEEGDIDFDDLDDIDRALEVALEKKLEKKKVELAKISDRELKNDEDSKKVVAAAGDAVVLSQDVVEEALDSVKGLPATGAEKQTALSRDVKSEVSDENNTKLEAELKDMADLALSKLEFLDISTENLSRLQVLFIELQTRNTDWIAGGLSTQYFYEQLKVAEGLLEQYELSAVPEGWACQWDRANSRYYYRNKVTNRIQWEYPEVEGAMKEESKSAVTSEESSTKVRESGKEDTRKQRSAGSRSHRKSRDEKDRGDRGKYDKRSSSHRYRRKRRRRRDHSSSSNSSEESQQHRHHHKSKKKKRHRSDRSPSVEIVEDIDGMDVEEIEDPATSLRQSSPQTADTPSDISVEPPLISSAIDIDIPQTGKPPPPPPPPPQSALEEAKEGGATSAKDAEKVDDGDDVASVDQEEKEETSEASVKNTAVISKPPQIVVPPEVAAAITPELQAAPTLYSAPQISVAGQATSYTGPPHSSAISGDQTQPSTETNNESAETNTDADKQAKKKKKEKKSLATGSSIMMKKKHMSTMVQKWQKVKKEVEKEDLAKEIRQAAIRKKIEELK